VEKTDRMFTKIFIGDVSFHKDTISRFCTKLLTDTEKQTERTT